MPTRLYLALVVRRNRDPNWPDSNLLQASLHIDHRAHFTLAAATDS